MQLQPPFSGNSNSGTETEVRSSVIIVTFNSEAFTRLCLASVIKNTDADDYEIIVVDNASSDSTREFLAAVVGCHRHVQVILNEANRGFAAANNQGMAAARGDHLVLLNNDTIVAPGWLKVFQSHLMASDVGMVGATTNRAANQSRIDTSYDTYGEFLKFAGTRLVTCRGKSLDIPMLIMFAAAIRRAVYEEVGPLDENFGIGMFEDDDYSVRVRAQGYRILCAEDLFIHHFGQGSFGALVASGEYNRLFDRNKDCFEKKWNRKWEPCKPRDSLEYQVLLEQVGDAVEMALPASDRSCVVAIVARGDQRLLDAVTSYHRSAHHFPREADGSPSAHYPADGRAALDMIHAEKLNGTDYLFIPRPYLWWLEVYREMAAALIQYCRRVDAPDECCVIFDLSTLPTGSPR